MYKNDTKDPNFAYVQFSVELYFIKSKNSSKGYIPVINFSIYNLFSNYLSNQITSLALIFSYPIFYSNIKNLSHDSMHICSNIFLFHI